MDNTLQGTRWLIVGLLSRGHKPNFYSLLEEEMFTSSLDVKVIRALKQGYEFKNQDWNELRKVAGLSALEVACLVGDMKDYSGWIQESDITDFVLNYRKSKALEFIKAGNIDLALEYSNSSFVNKQSVYEDWKKSIEDIRSRSDEGILGLHTGIGLLDKYTSGFQESKIWVVGAYNGFGKTFFMTNMVNKVLDSGEKAVVFTLEMKKEDILNRLIGEKLDIGVYELAKTCNQEVVEEEMLRIKKHLEDGTLRVYDSLYDVADIISQARVESANGRIGVMFVDFIQLVKDRESGSRYEVVSNVSVKLQELAKELNCCTMLLTQVSNASQAGTAGDVYGFKGAGEIGQIADVAIKIQRGRADNGEFTDEFILDIVKNRTGKSGVIDCKISFPGGKITEGPIRTDIFDGVNDKFEESVGGLLSL